MSASDQLKDYVYEGVWQRYDQPSFRRWVWTLQDWKAFIVLALFTSALAFTQGRAWVLIRSGVLSQTKSPRLHDPLKLDRLERLSQGEAIVGVPLAIVDILSDVKAWYVKVMAPGENEFSLNREREVHSPWFSILAALNVALFVCLGGALSWFLTDGALEAPVVKSKITTNCLNSTMMEFFVHNLHQPSRADAIFGQCRDNLNQTCASQYYLRIPQVQINRLSGCPFPGNICLNGVSPLEITRSNITAFDMGVNARSPLSINHRLTCAPSLLDQFLVEKPNNYSRYHLAITRPELTDSYSHAFYELSTPLSTDNGPNAFSNESSGRTVALSHAQPRLRVLPNRLEVTYPKNMSNLMHPAIYRDDGMTFLVAFRPGRTPFATEMDDPFFSAHNELAFGSDASKLYFADREVAALACIEQFQYCIKGNDCSPWGKPRELSRMLLRRVLQTMDIDMIEDAAFLFFPWPENFSTWNYLTQLIEYHGMLPISNSGLRVNGILFFKNNIEQWTVEVKTWFMKSMLSGILGVQEGVKFHLTDWNTSIDLKKKYSLCGRVLFRDGDHTNLNWVGFWATLGSMGFICTASYSINLSPSARKKIISFLTKKRQKVISIFKICRIFLSWIWRKRWEIWAIVLGALRYSGSRSGRVPLTVDANNSELQDLENNSTTRDDSTRSTFERSNAPRNNLEQSDLERIGSERNCSDQLHCEEGNLFHDQDRIREFMEIDNTV